MGVAACIPNELLLVCFCGFCAARGARLCVLRSPCSDTRSRRPVVSHHGPPDRRNAEHADGRRIRRNLPVGERWVWPHPYLTDRSWCSCGFGGARGARPGALRSSCSDPQSRRVARRNVCAPASSLAEGLRTLTSPSDSEPSEPRRASHSRPSRYAPRAGPLSRTEFSHSMRLPCPQPRP